MAHQSNLDNRPRNTPTQGGTQSALILGSTHRLDTEPPSTTGQGRGGGEALRESSRVGASQRTTCTQEVHHPGAQPNRQGSTGKPAGWSPETGEADGLLERLRRGPKLGVSGS